MEHKFWKRYVFEITVLVFVFIIFYVHYSNKFYPHTFINGVAVGGMTYVEAQTKIKSVLEDIKVNGFNLEFVRENNIRKVNIPTSVTGFTPDTVVEYFSVGDVEETLKKAYERGREQSFIRRWINKIYSSLLKKTFFIPYSIQKEAIFSLLDRELNGFLNGPQNAEFVESDGKIIISEGKFGADIDYEMAVKGMDDVLFNVNTENLRFKVNLIAPPIIAEDLKSKLDFANALAESVNLEFWSGINWWRVRGPILATWFTTNKDDKEIIEIKDDKLKNFIRLNIDSFIDGKMVNSRFEMQNKKLVEIVPGKAGQEVDFDKLKIDIEKELQRIYQNYRGSTLLTTGIGKIKPEMLAVKFDLKKVLPRVTKETIEQYKITDLIGTARTNFAGGAAPRINNIKVGTSKLNGVLIAPGEEFSAAETIGMVNEEEGYQKELIIKVDKTVKEFGGGLCQIATTLFRSVLNAGLPVTERKNHSYVVGYYGPGLDATIYGPYFDLKFVNDTENYILLQGAVENNSNLIFEFYGRKDGRKISVSEPRLHDIIPPSDTKYIPTIDLPLAEKKCTERRINGVTADVDYRVEYADSSVREQTFTSVYKPWQEVCLLGARL